MSVAALPSTVDVFNLLHRPGEHVSVCHQAPGGAFRADIVPAEDAPAVALALGPGVNVWFGVNPVTRDAAGRGSIEDVTRLAALWADLDVKPGGLPTFDAARAVIRDLSTMLNAQPVAQIYSGHGMQPLWLLDPDDPETDTTDPTNRTAAIAMLRRWGRLVARVAANHGGQVDSVFDLTRVLRVPGTTNHKDTPVPVVARPGTGYALTVRDVAEILDEWAPERPEDTEQLGPVISSPTGWAWGPTTCGYVKGMVAGWATDTPDARHPWLVAQATRLAAAHRLGCVTETDHEDAWAALNGRFAHLLTTGQARREQPRERADAHTWGVRRVAAMTEERARAELGNHTHRGPDTDTLDGLIAPTGHDDADAEELELDTFWRTRPVLEHLHNFARARRVAPWAVLGVTLARVVAVVPPAVVLPSLVGGHGSLNLFVGIVGRSGAGKGTAETAAEDALPLPDPIAKVTVGSGEGIAHAYVKRTKEGVEQHTYSVMFGVPEVDTLTALGDRRGATLLPELRRAWSGERLGFAYSDPTKRLPVPAHAYRMTLVVGIQPERAGRLLDDADGGTPQRFVWLPSEDTHAPDLPPDEPPAWDWTPPRWPQRAWGTPRMILHVCRRAREDVDADRLARLRGHGHELDGHAMFARLKIAAALAVLDGRSDVNDADWFLAAYVADKSRTTRQGIADALANAATTTNRRRAEAEADRAVLVAEKVEDSAVRRVARRLAQRLEGQGWVSRNDLRKACTSGDRAHFDAAVDAAIAAGQIEAEDVAYRGQTGRQYRKADH